MSGAALLVQGLHTRRGRFHLGPLELSVPASCCLTVQGVNGSGKTTLLEAIAGFAAIHGGRITLQGRDITAEAPERRRIAYVPQDLALFPHLSVEHNVAFGLRGGMCAGRSLLEQLLDEFELGHLRARRPQELSRGQCQRLALARALAMEPSLVLLDEPSANLDADSRQTLHRGARRLVEEHGLAVLYVTHDQNEVAALADHVAILADGRLLQAGPYAEVMARPTDTRVARQLGIENLWPARVVGSSSRGLCLEVAGRTLQSTWTSAPDGALRVGLCPGDIELAHSPPAATDNCLEVTVSALHTTGALSALRLDGPPPLQACVPGWWARELAVGSRLWARLPPEALRLIPQYCAQPEEEGRG